jgi:hypothetical protein
MKKFFVGSIIFAFVFIASAYAQTPILTCFTEDDSIGFVNVIQNKDGTGRLVINNGGEGADAFEQDFILVSGLQDLQKSDSATLIAVKNRGVYTPRAYTAVPEAAMMRVLPGKKEARLAANGLVYVLRCNPAPAAVPGNSM